MKKGLLFIYLCLLLSKTFVFSDIKFKNPDAVLFFVKKHLPDNPVILEAGGRYGKDTRRMKRFWPNSVIHVFEPLPSSFEKLRANTENLMGVLLYPYALSSYVGTTDFYVDSVNNGASSINKPVDFNQHEFDKEPIKIGCVTIDFWAKKNNFPTIDFMWLDMESHELYALQNALTVLDSVKAIFTEISFEPIRQGGCLYKDVKKFLEDKGFREIGKEGVSKRFGNALFMR